MPHPLFSFPPDRCSYHNYRLSGRFLKQKCYFYLPNRQPVHTTPKKRNYEKSKQRNEQRLGLGHHAQSPLHHVSFTKPDGTAYGVPLSLTSTDDHVWYFHCALEGDKLEAIAAHPEVCLSAVTKCQPTVGPKDGSFTLQYRSAMAFGKAELVTDEAEKVQALKAISQRFLPQHMDAFDEAVRRSLHRTAVVRITLSAPPTGKRKQYDEQGEEMKYGRME